LASADYWRWTDDGGVQRLVSIEELRAALASGRLKPDTLVWHRGMSGWRPAASVPELATDDAAGGRRPSRIGPVGVIAARSPSIPPPEPGGQRVPSNIVDIDALRAQQGGGQRKTIAGIGPNDEVNDGDGPTIDLRERASDWQGVAGGGGAVVRDDPSITVSIPQPPKLPTGTGVGSSAPQGRKTAAQQKSARPSKPDGAWPIGRQRADEDDATTLIRPDRELPSAPAKREAKQRRAPAAGRPADRSGPPSRPRRSKPPPPPRRSAPKLRQAPASARGGAQARRLAATSGGSAGAPASARPKRTEAAPARRVATAPLPATEPRPQRQTRPSDAAERPAAQGSGAAARTGMATMPLQASAPEGSQTVGLPDGSEPKAGPQEVSAGSPKAEPQRPLIQPWEGGSDTLDRFDAQQGAGRGVLGSGKRSIRQAFTIRLSALVTAAVAVGLLIAGSFLVGWFVKPARKGGADVARAHKGLVAVPLFARTVGRLEPPKACLMLRAPERWAPAASKKISFELTATAEGKLAIGYARSSKKVRGLLIDPTTGVVKSRFTGKTTKKKLSRVVPLVGPKGVRYAPTLRKQGKMRNAVWVSAEKPFVVGFTATHCATAAAPGKKSRNLWKLAGKGTPAKLRTVAIPSRGVAVAYAHGGRNWYAWLDEDGEVAHPAAAVETKAATVGQPQLGYNEDELSLVFAEIPKKGAPARIRWARAPIGQPLGKPKVVRLPKGGPGGHAKAPAIAGLPGGRWLLMWTEGKVGGYVLRAQTYDRDQKPIGKALRVSPATGSFGQGAVGVEGQSAAVVFLMAAGREFEIWGTVLRCG